MYHKYEEVRGNMELVLQDFFKLLKEITNFMSLFRITLNNHTVMSSGPFWKTRGKSINQIAWILQRAMSVPPFTPLDGPRRSKSWGSRFWFYRWQWA